MERQKLVAALGAVHLALLGAEDAGAVAVEAADAVEAAGAVDDTASEFLLLLGAAFTIPGVMETLRKGRRRRKRCRSADRSQGGLCEDDWRETGQPQPDFDNRLYLETYHVDKRIFQFLFKRYGRHLAKQDTNWHEACPADKQFQVLLDWLASGETVDQLAHRYSLSNTTVWRVLHAGIDHLKRTLVPDAIYFPKGGKLQEVMDGLEHKCYLPYAMGALDGTLFKIEEPAVCGSCYYSDQGFYAVKILAVCDAEGIFLYVEAGKPGSESDDACWDVGALKRALERRELGIAEPRDLGIERGAPITPYLVGDSAFGISDVLTNCWDGGVLDELPVVKQRFNGAVAAAHRVVGDAFERLKGRWAILQGAQIDDPDFAADVALVCCALHNVCQRHHSPFKGGWQPTPADMAHDARHVTDAGDERGLGLRDVLTKYLNRLGLPSL